MPTRLCYENIWDNLHQRAAIDICVHTILIEYF
jgi:hypothetical protein